MLFNSSLILEGGGMRGLFTAGILDFFLEKDIYFTDCYAVSAGACHACSYLSGQRGRAYDISVDYLDDRHYCGVYSFLTTGDLFGVKMAYETIPKKLNPFDYDAFVKNPCRFYAVLTNCRTGGAEYKRVADLRRDMKIIRASSSLPLLSRYVTLEGERYLDGGIADSVPIKKSLEDGRRKNVLLLTQHRGYRKGPDKALALIRARYCKCPELIRAMRNRHLVYNETLDFIEAEERAGNIFVLRPEAPVGFARIEKDRKKLRALYESGYRLAGESYVHLLNYLEARDKRF